ncbi:MAG: type II toxin-antitoxin system VapC family toxin [Verrucomicrobia bacterium]|nr:type II toxin-antitoxin system VapC family toxin [Verrucomicrobiota bacterium]MCH8528656.1 type II toxin-antitoxin system VapC family toxin [Kiritimatiellia bacterium]
MIALDTNVLVRFFTRDDPEQFAKVRALVSKEDESFFIPDIAAVEMVWVLAGSYEWPRDRIVAALRQLITRTNTEFQNRAGFSRAVMAYENGADFADALIHEICLSAGCDSLATFDNKMRRIFPETTFEP